MSSWNRQRPEPKGIGPSAGTRKGGFMWMENKCNKLVRLSKPVKVVGKNKGTSLLHNLSIFQYEFIWFYSTGSGANLLKLFFCNYNFLGHFIQVVNPYFNIKAVMILHSKCRLLVLPANIRLGLNCSSDKMITTQHNNLQLENVYSTNKFSLIGHL
jgi:hypothetical protein